MSGLVIVSGLAAVVASVLVATIAIVASRGANRH